MTQRSRDLTPATGRRPLCSPEERGASGAAGLRRVRRRRRRGGGAPAVGERDGDPGRPLRRRLRRLGGHRAEGRWSSISGAMWRIADSIRRASRSSSRPGSTGPQLSEALAAPGLHARSRAAVDRDLDGRRLGRDEGVRSALGPLRRDRGSRRAGWRPSCRTAASSARKINPRRSAGPDVASLMIGSEGTLGIVTDVALRIVPIPEVAERSLPPFRAHGGRRRGRQSARAVRPPADCRAPLRPRGCGALPAEPSRRSEGPLLIMSFDGWAADEQGRRSGELTGGTDRRSRARRALVGAQERRRRGVPAADGGGGAARPPRDRRHDGGLRDLERSARRSTTR